MNAVSPPQPLVSDLTRFFWEGLAQRRLMILRCQSCGHYIHYPRPICNRCRSEDLAPAAVSGKGTLYAYTVAVQVFHPYWTDKAPYTLAVVELAEEPGLRVTTNIVDCAEEDLRTGMPVEIVYTEVWPSIDDGRIAPYVLPMFRPAAA